MKIPRFTSLFTYYHLLQWVVNLCDQLIESVSWLENQSNLWTNHLKPELFRSFSCEVDWSIHQTQLNDLPMNQAQLIRVCILYQHIFDYTLFHLESKTISRTSGHHSIISLFRIVVILVSLFFICSLSCLVLKSSLSKILPSYFL